MDDCDYKVGLSPQAPGIAHPNMKDPVLGIDIALATFVAALRFDDGRLARMEFANNPNGFRQLLNWLRRHFVGQLAVGLESTSTYGDALAQWLFAHGHTVYLLNPERVATYARSQGQRNKTDPSDAAMIAAFTAQYKGTPWQPPSPEQKKLRSLTRTRHQLVCCQTQLKLQIRTAEPAGAVHLKAVLKKVQSELQALTRQLKEHLRHHPTLDGQVKRLRTFKSVGLTTAATLVAELPPIGPDSDPRSICVWAGVIPQRRQSGPKEYRTRLSRKGNAYLREALYMPALVGRRYNPVLRAFAARLKQKGKTSGAILGAVSHKMLRILVGMLRTQTDFDPNWSPSMP